MIAKRSADTGSMLVPSDSEERNPVLISTMNDVPGYRVSRVLGECFGLTVRSRNAFSQIGAGFKSLVGGELVGMTKNLQKSRQEVIDRMVQEATTRGANAVRSEERRVGKECRSRRRSAQKKK